VSSKGLHWKKPGLASVERNAKRHAGEERVKSNRLSHGDAISGILILMIGLGAIAMGATYTIGSPSNMGPGFVPVALGCILTLVGALIAVAARKVGGQSQDRAAKSEWRGWTCIIASMIAFVVLGRYAGLIPASFAVVFIAALGDRQNSLKDALLLAAAMVVVCLVVFSWALDLEFPLLTWGLP
jgi:hypothetical protein